MFLIWNLNKKFVLNAFVLQQKRAEIENKLDQADLQEREAVKKEREKLFKERKVKKLKLKCLEEKLQRAEIVILLILVF